MEDLKDQCEHELVSQLLSGAPLEVETGGGEEAGRGKEAATDDLVATSPDETSAGSPSLAALLIFLRLADLHSARKLAAICLGTVHPPNAACREARATDGLLDPTRSVGR
jgi:hypothetical protein